MQLGTEFLKSKIARRFCLLFILCAFVPTLTLVVLSYNKVIDQLEEQSLDRLKREAQAYGVSLFDRMIRLDNELQIIGRNIEDDKRNNSGNRVLLSIDNEQLFSGVYLYNEEKKIIPVFGVVDTEVIKSLWTEDLQEHDKPFILSLPRPGKSGRIFFGTNMRKTNKSLFSIIGEVRPEYLWGVGPSPILPPMTELSVYDKNGSSIMASINAPEGDYEDLPDHHTSQEPGVYRFEKNGKIFFASASNLFVEARFQPTGWHIFFSQARADMMSSVENFKQSFPFVVLLFLLLILYLSVFFIRKGLEPLEKLKEGTKRIALKDFSKDVDISSGDEFEELGDSFNEMAGKLDNQFHALNLLGEIDRAILSSVGKSQILTTTLQSFKIFFRCDIVIFVTNIVATKGHVNVYIMQGQRKNDPHSKYFALEEDEHEKLFIDSDHEILTDKESYPEFLKNIDGGQFSKLLYLPLKIGGNVNRVLILGWVEDHRFKEDELNQARQVANQLAVALTNSKLLEDMEKLAMGTIQALARTVDAKSKWTSGHSERVSAMGGRIAKVMGISKKEIDTITRGGLLHDIGKIGIPVAILDKPAGLTDKEFAEIKNHPAIGAKILEPITAYHDILPLVLHHHEKFDGSGYPDGLKGDEIDIRARILAVADVWDALVSDRPYREGWVQDRAKKMIVDGSGSHFDPKVVEAFMAIVDIA
jgi:HD-GYP domain-containing protein (c-di-GMP phosphodiesterase class II)/HAMP domain-containing protein